MEQLDALDRTLSAALLHCPRAPVSELAHVLGYSASTVSRRLSALIDTGVLRPSASVSWGLSGTGHPSILRIRCTPASIRSVAETLANEPRAQSVFILAGSADIHCLLHPSEKRSISSFVLDRLPQIEGVLSTDTNLVLGTAVRSGHWKAPGVLSPDQETYLGQLAPSAPAASQQNSDRTTSLKPLDQRVVNALIRDGRITVNSLAEQLDINRMTARRALHSVFSSGLVSPRVDLEPEFLGFRMGTSLSLRCSPSAVPGLLHSLGQNPHVRFAAMTAGQATIIAHASLTDEAALRHFIQEDLGVHPEISDLGVNMMLETVKRNWRRYSGEGLTLDSDLHVREE